MFNHFWLFDIDDRSKCTIIATSAYEGSKNKAFDEWDEVVKFTTGLDAQ